MNPGTFTHWLDEDSGDMFQQAMACWAKHWDWDRPTLFGSDPTGLDAAIADRFVAAADAALAAVFDRLASPPVHWRGACALPGDSGVAVTDRPFTEGEALATDLYWPVSHAS